ncbi:hypothetical protein SESI111939_19125 [Serratia silvae]
MADNLDPQKTPASVVEVGRADPDVIKSQFYPTNRDGLLQQGGTSQNSKFIDIRLLARDHAVLEQRTLADRAIFYTAGGLPRQEGA